MRSESNGGYIAMGKFGGYILSDTPRASGNYHFALHAYADPELVLDDAQFSFGGSSQWGTGYGTKVNGRGANHGE